MIRIHLLTQKKERKKDSLWRWRLPVAWGGVAVTQMVGFIVYLSEKIFVYLHKDSFFVVHLFYVLHKYFYIPKLVLFYFVVLHLLYMTFLKASDFSP